MSTRMRSSTYLKPPLPKSPIRLRSRSRQASLLSNASSTLQTPPGLAKLGRRLSHGDIERKLPMVETGFGEEKEDMKLEDLAADSAPPVFERGRFYEEYSARRNDRLKRKNGGEEGTNYCLGVEPVTAKRRGTIKKTTTVETTSTKPRYSLRSMTKENKKPPLPVNVDVTSAKMKSVTTMRTRMI